VAALVGRMDPPARQQRRPQRREVAPVAQFAVEHHEGGAGDQGVGLRLPRGRPLPLSEQELRERKIRAQTGKKVQDFYTTRDFEFSVVSGIVSRVDVEQGGRRWILHDAPTNPGNSGGPASRNSRRLSTGRRGTAGPPARARGSRRAPAAAGHRWPRPGRPAHAVCTTGKVLHVRFNANGQRVVTASEDATHRLWNARTGELIAVLRGHGDTFDPNCPPVLTPDGSRLVSGAMDGTVCIWDMSLLERNGILKGHESYVYDVAFSPNGAQVASAAWDGTARLWDATTGQPTGLLKHEMGIITSVAYSRDGWATRFSIGTGNTAWRP